MISRFRFFSIITSFLLFSLNASEKEISLDLSTVEHSIVVTKRHLADVEMLLIDAFAPLQGFMNKENYDRVVSEMRLSDGTLWPIPIVLDVEGALAKQLRKGTLLGLKDLDGSFVAVLEVSDIWSPNKNLEMEKVYGMTNPDHFGVAYLKDHTKDYYVGGKLHKVKDPDHFDFIDLRYTPKELKEYFHKNAIKEVVAFQTRNPMHRAHYELTKRASAQAKAHLLIQPIVGPTKDGDIDPHTRVRCYRDILKYYPENSVTLSVLPLAMRMAGPREALLHAIIRKNYGCTHFIVGRDHAGPGKDQAGTDFYEPYEAQELVMKYADEIGIQIIPFMMMGYLEEEGRYIPMNEIKEGQQISLISGTELRSRLAEKKEIPTWFTFPEVTKHLKNAFIPSHKKGLTLFLTGLSASGKSTLAKALEAELKEMQSRTITIFDGDKVRKLLSSDLGFSKKDRSTNIRRIGYVASEVTKCRGIAICCFISPYEEDRNFARNLIQEYGNFVEIHVSTPLEVCEKRDRKGLYKKARDKRITQFTGIDDPYEVPKNPELTIDMTNIIPEEAVEIVINYLREKKHLR